MRIFDIVGGVSIFSCIVFAGGQTCTNASSRTFAAGSELAAQVFVEGPNNGSLLADAQFSYTATGSA